MRKKLMVLSLFAAVIPLTLALFGASSNAARVQKYWVCHTTGSATNPYVLIPVPLHSARKHIGRHTHRGPGDLSDAFAFGAPGELDPPAAAAVIGTPGKDRARVAIRGARP